mmetsp:Transcript_17666/g.70926  ORF Transcript_17666/g.70926 Transcript_17666/m.70926 type:complete len:204 (-) Transcript_17666:22-633(-)
MRPWCPGRNTNVSAMRRSMFRRTSCSSRDDTSEIDGVGRPPVTSCVSSDALAKARRMTAASAQSVSRGSQSGIADAGVAAPVDASTVMRAGSKHHVVAGAQRVSRSRPRSSRKVAHSSAVTKLGMTAPRSPSGSKLKLCDPGRSSWSASMTAFLRAVATTVGETSTTTATRRRPLLRRRMRSLCSASPRGQSPWTSSARRPSQ